MSIIYHVLILVLITNCVLDVTAQGGSDPRRIFVGGLRWDTNEDSLTNYFSRYGKVLKVTVMIDPITRRSRGFGFVTFEDPTIIFAVMKNGPHVIDSKTVDIKRTVKNDRTVEDTSKGQKTNTIFVGGMSLETTKQDVRLYFSAFGHVTKVDLKMKRLPNAEEIFRGFGFVSFDSHAPVEKVSQIHFHQLNGKTVEVKEAETNEQNPFHGRQQNQNSGGHLVPSLGHDSAYGEHQGGQGFPYRQGSAYGQHQGEQGFPYGQGSAYGPHQGGQGFPYGQGSAYGSHQGRQGFPYGQGSAYGPHQGRQGFPYGQGSAYGPHQGEQGSPSGHDAFGHGSAYGQGQDPHYGQGS